MDELRDRYGNGGGDWGKDPNENLEDSYLVRCIRASELRKWQDEYGKSAAIRRLKYSSLEKRRLQEGDILVEVSGGGPDQAVGRTVLITNTVLSNDPELDYVCTNFFRFCRPSKEIQAKFLNWYLTYFYRSGGTEELQGGSNNLRNLRFPDFVAQKVPIPPLNEQRRIVEKIEAMFDEIDKGVESLRTARNSLGLYGQSLLLLSDGQLHRRDVKDDSVAVVEFQSYAFDLADLKPANQSDWIRPSERSTADLISPNPADKLYREKPGSLSSELTDRMTSWLYAVAFALWAIVVAGQPRTNRQASSAAMALGLTGGLGLKALGFLVLAQVDGASVWTLAAYVLPLLAIALDAWLIWADADITEWTVYRRTVEAMEAIGNAIARLFESARIGTAGAGR